jgi:hypothetical protein
MSPVEMITKRQVKPSFAISVAFMFSTLVMAEGTFIWYLSSTAEFSRKASPPAAAAAPKAQPARPPAKKPKPR